MIQCRHCLSHNYFPEYRQIDAYAWECWNCFNIEWLSDDLKQDYMVFNSLTAEQADQHLYEDRPIFLVGQSTL